MWPEHIQVIGLNFRSGALAWKSPVNQEKLSVFQEAQWRKRKKLDLWWQSLVSLKPIFTLPCFVKQRYGGIMRHNKLHIFKVYNLMSFDIWISHKTTTTNKMVHVSIISRSFLLLCDHSHLCPFPSNIWCVFGPYRLVAFSDFHINRIIQIYFSGLVSFIWHNYFEIYSCWVYQKFISLCGSAVCHCMDIPPFVYPFTCWWTFGLSLVFSYYK